MRKQSKGYTATLSYDDYEEERESDQINNFVAFTAYIIDDANTGSNTGSSSSNRVDISIPIDDDDGLFDEFLADACKVLYYKSIKESQVLENQRGMIKSLMSENY